MKIASVAFALFLLGFIGYFAGGCKSSNIYEAKKMLKQCDNIQFSGSEVNYGFLDVEGLNNESVETKRNIVLHLLETGTPFAEPPGAAFYGHIELVEKGKVVQTIHVFMGGFSLNGKDYSVAYKGDKDLERLYAFKTEPSQ